ncbi:hypothetical protein [Mycolicibacterium diernhoferi]|nr:hypothetical protein [Mycolicibacterium diernhoferi]QYL21959.1 hypothetical protein K0O62_23735 [Mycolicibacterium diernhoferi]
MMVKLTKMMPALFAGAAGAAIAFSPVAGAIPEPPPPPACVNPDGTPCVLPGSAGPGGATGQIPGGPGGTAGPGGAQGAIPGGPAGEAGPGGASGVIPGGPAGTAGPGGASGVIPGGPVGSAGPGGASGCIPGVGCATIPAP